MELTGKVTIAASRNAVWAALNDSEVLRACIPGCEEVIDESPLVRRVQLMVKVGPVRARFSGRVTLSEVHQPQSCVLSFEGSGGAAGMASGQSRVKLDDENGGTSLTYSVNASVGGKLGQIGGRLIDSSARQLANQFFSAFRDRMTGGAVAPATDGPLSAVAPTQPPPAAIGAAASLMPGGGEGARLLWFLMGMLSTGIGVAIGAFVFGRAG